VLAVVSDQLSIKAFGEARAQFFFKAGLSGDDDVVCFVSGVSEMQNQALMIDWMFCDAPAAVAIALRFPSQACIPSGGVKGSIKAVPTSWKL
jgi:hypothetical protein